MALTINTNTAATAASASLNKNNSYLQKSLARLSSGKRITTPADDAGGLAVSMKLTASINRTKSAIANIQNAVSYGDVQDGALQSAARIVDRMAELKSLSLDVMKSPSDVANYDTEFGALQRQLYQVGAETFNGVSLFATTNEAGADSVFGTAAGANTMSVFTSSEGSAGSKVSVSKSLLLSAVTFDYGGGDPLAAKEWAAGINSASADRSLAAEDEAASVGLDKVSIGLLTKALENIATLRAANGATSARLSFSEDHLRLNKANLEAANSRIMDVDVAEESTQLAKFNILSQASAAMLAQANSMQSTALMLLG
ncbi:MAG: flagellin [Opitutae bacterium]|jgi:flagellin|nr:flagellin [Opitutae bacterium]MBT5910848.1 flagellin [Opitutae bacterium]MBT7742872.1 flagellin [Opitutae bacterium]